MKKGVYISAILLLASPLLRAMEQKQSKPLVNNFYDLVDNEPETESHSATTATTENSPTSEDQQLELQRRADNYALFTNFICIHKTHNHIKFCRRDIPDDVIDIIDAYYETEPRLEIILRFAYNRVLPPRHLGGPLRYILIEPDLPVKYKPSIRQDYLLNKIYRGVSWVPLLQRHENVVFDSHETRTYHSLPKSLRDALMSRYSPQLTQEVELFER